ncbi:MAG TPA: hypothetical protein VFS11_00775 [Gemmatimonadales bacterium]|nr:hypothetical protein [Gemmatimonadales bacterium]
MAPTPGLIAVSQNRLYPRGNPLTESMPFTTYDGVHWLAYVEGLPADPPPRWRHRAIIPGRRLRFDSAFDSRVSPVLPAGSPFLPEAVLRELLAAAEPVPPPPHPARRRDDARSRSSAVAQWAKRTGELVRETAADWAARWRQGAARRQALRDHVQQRILDAYHALAALLAEGLRAGGRRARR